MLSEAKRERVAEAVREVESRTAIRILVVAAFATVVAAIGLNALEGRVESVSAQTETACAEAERAAAIAFRHAVLGDELPETGWLLRAVRELARARRLCAERQEQAGLAAFATLQQFTRAKIPLKAGDPGRR